MKTILFITILFSGSLIYSQIKDIKISDLTIEEAFRPKMPTKTDTIYYPFYDGVQMIEVDYIGYWDRKIYFLEQTQPRAMEHSFFNPRPLGNEYIFRDSTGTIVKAYNSRRNLTDLTKHFKRIPMNKKHNFSNIFTYHSSQQHRYNGVWAYSSNYLFNFNGNYKVLESAPEHLLEGLFPRVEKDQLNKLKYGLIDSLGNVKIPLEYSEITPWHENLLVQKNGKWGIISYDHEVVVPIIYDNYKVN